MAELTTKERLILWCGSKLKEAGIEFSQVYGTDISMTDVSGCTKGCCPRDVRMRWDIDYKNAEGLYRTHHYMQEDLEVEDLVTFIDEVNQQQLPDSAHTKQKLKDIANGATND